MAEEQNLIRLPGISDALKAGYRTAIRRDEKHWNGYHDLYNGKSSLILMKTLHCVPGDKRVQKTDKNLEVVRRPAPMDLPTGLHNWRRDFTKECYLSESAEASQLHGGELHLASIGSEVNECWEL